jgi:hypothetical protein
MNQVMINAVDLEMLVQEIKDLKVKIAELNKLLADERGRNKVPEREWVGLDGEIPGLGLVTEEFYNGMIVCRRHIEGEEHMTPYDRWKLATPNYLEDEDDGAISRVHSTIIDGEDGPDLRTDLRFDSQDEGQELDHRHQEDQ